MRDSHFANQGLKRDEVGAPTIDRGGYLLRGTDCAAPMFGDPDIFNPVGGHQADQEHIDNSLDGIVNEHAVVEARLRWLLANSEVVS